MRCYFETGALRIRWLAAAVLLSGAAFSTGCVHPRARNVAYDPFIPSVLAARSEASFQSVAYGGASVDASVTTREEHKEIIDFDE
jgi:hypothetical protein